MIGRRLCAIASLTLLPLLASAATQAVKVTVVGAVAHPGTYSLAAPAHLADATAAAGVTPDAYVLGAAWLQTNQLHAQQRLRAGVLFDLDSIVHAAAADGNDPLARVARRLQGTVRAMPVTGRRVPPTLDPDALAFVAADNLGLAEGDRLVYPQRPTTVRVLGAVEHPCTLAQVADRGARRYLDDCPASAAADPDWVFVIEPDGRVFRHGVAPWNLDAPLLLAPGAVLYVPLGLHAVKAVVDGQFNRHVADFLATQVLDPAGATP